MYAGEFPFGEQCRHRTATNVAVAQEQHPRRSAELRERFPGVGWPHVRTALSIARECRTILGGSGITLEYSPLRHANNLESVLTYEGTHEVHTLVVGEALTGVNAFGRG